jgi:hypothetical protein
MTTQEQNERCGHTAEVPTRVAAALAELDVERRAAETLPRATAEEHAVWAARLALLDAREAGWWRVLARWTYRESQLPTVYGRAATTARFGARESARFWRQAGADWQRRAERGVRS